MTENPGQAWDNWVLGNRKAWANSKATPYNYEIFAQCEACLAFTPPKDLEECPECKTLVCPPCLDSDTGYHGPGTCEPDEL